MTIRPNDSPDEFTPQEDECPWIVDTTLERFELDVVERSKVTPVVVDFWAPWCQPCRTLGPILESLAREYEGAFVLVRANADELQEVARQFQVQSIPAVFGLVDGEVSDFFQGIMPKQQLGQWVDRLLLQATLVEARALEISNSTASQQLYRKVLDKLPELPEAMIGLARVLLDDDQPEEAQVLIDSLEKRGFLEPETQKLKAKLDLRTKAVHDVDELRQAAEAAPNQLELQLNLAEALAAQEQFEESLQLCLSLVAKDKVGVGESARQVMVGIFHVLPNDSELTRTYRRQLSSLLF